MNENNLRLDDLLPKGWRDNWTVQQKLHAIDQIKYNWRFWARPEQIPPAGDWDVWLILAGRGYGKTRTGAEWMKEKLLANAGWRAGIIAPSYGSARDVCLEGESGILGVLRDSEIRKYNRSLGQVTLVNGSKIAIYSGNDPEKLRGPQHHMIWYDELAAFQYLQETWDMAMMGLRLGVHPQSLITTTPRPVPLLKELVQRYQDGDDTVALTKGSTFDNSANLAGSTLRALLERYDGTHLGRQELYAELISDAPGALWSRANLDETRFMKTRRDLPRLVRVVVAIDPSVSMGKRSNETGIIVAGKGTDGHAYILDDQTQKQASPETWAKAAIQVFRDEKADRIVVEQNNGGDMCSHTLRTIEPNIPIKTVYASRGKLTRAEPISALYEQKRVHHVGIFADLEDQQCSWVPGQGESPDRVDALVWALTELMLGGGISEVYTPGYSGAGALPRM